MPNRKTHIQVGVPAGMALAAYRARNESTVHLLLETAGGALGGWAGSRAPDVLEPATGWDHRSFCHSWTVLLAGTLAGIKALPKWEKFCREKASAAAKRRLMNEGLSDGDTFLLHIWEALWRIAAGILAGFIAGYGSHLLLDATTRRSLPVVT